MRNQRSSRQFRYSSSPHYTLVRTILHIVLPLIGALSLGLSILTWVYHQPFTRIYEPGSKDSELPGIFPREGNGVIDYAYSRGQVSIELPQVGHGNVVATLRLGGPSGTLPVTTRIYTGALQLALGAIAPIRTYHLLIPPDAQGNVGLVIDSETRQIPTDRRELGVLIDWIELRSLPDGAAPRLSLRFTALVLMLWPVILLLPWGYWWKRGGFLLLSIGITAAYSRSRGISVVNDTPLLIVVGLGALSQGIGHLLSNDDVPYLGRLLRQKRYRQIVGEIIVSLVVLGCYVWHVRRYADFIIDDTYISLVYVKNVLHGNGLSFNGDYVAGYSNFLWVIALAMLGMLGLDLTIAAKSLGVACAVLVFVMLVKISRMLLQDRASGLLASALLAASSSFVVWSVAGLETLGFTLLLVASIYLILSEEQHARIRWSVLTLAGLALIRPEGIGLMLMLIAIRILIRVFNYGRRALQSELVATSLIPCGIYLVFLTWHKIVYGYPLPTTVYAKTGNLAGQIRNGTGYILSASYQMAPLMIGLIVLLPVIFIPRHRRLPNSLLLLTILAYSIFIIVSGGDWMPVYRFLVPLLPLVFLVGAQEIVILGKWLGGHARSRSYTLVFLTSVLALSQVWQASLANHEIVRTVARASQGSVEVGRMMGRLAGPQDTIALIDAGAIPFFTDSRIIDMVGLNNNYIAHLPGGFLEKYDNTYVLAQQPTFVQLHVTGFEAGYIPVDFIGAEELYYSAEFHQWYKQIPESPFIFERRATPLSSKYVASFYDVDYKAALPSAVSAATQSTLTLTVTNRGGLSWPAWHNTTIIMEWHSMTGQLISTTQHIALPNHVRPGESITLNVNLTPPLSSGQYQLVIDVERTRLFRFSERGAAPFRTTIEVK